MPGSVRTPELFPALEIQRFSLVLSPAIVATIVCAEQTFTVPANVRLPADGIVIVNCRAGSGGALEICAARVASTTTIGITWVNPTGGGLTPTAAALYDVSVISTVL